MKKVLLNKECGGFRLPLEIKFWLLKKREAFHLFGKEPLKSSSFCESVVLDKIKENDVDFAGKVSGEWGYFNWFVVNLKEKCFYGLRWNIKIGLERSDSDLIDSIERFKPDGFKISQVEEHKKYKIEQTRNGEKIITL